MFYFFRETQNHKQGTEAENMSIKKVKAGYYYSFMLNGKRYNGTCKDCKSKAEALQFESKIREFTKNMRTITNEKALLIQYRKEISGIKDIPLPDLAEMAINKPQAIKRSEHENSLYLVRWKSFVSFMKYYFPDVRYAGDILVSHAEKYIQFLHKYGAFHKAKLKGDTVVKWQNLAPATILQYITAVDFILTKTANDTGIPYSPFFYKKVIRPKKINAVDREAFTPEELQKISENMFDYPHFQKLTYLNKTANPPRLGQLFMIAYYTGLRLGDCCNLKWSDIDLQRGFINLKTRKTGKQVNIPIIQKLALFLENYKAREAKENLQGYVFPFWQDLHHRSPSQICFYIKTFFADIGIKSQKKNDAGRNQPVKGFHSFRHTFATMAITNGVPLNVVQFNLGHTNAKMTEYYSRHVSAETMKEKMKYIPALIGSGATAEMPEHLEAEKIRAEIISKLDGLSKEQLQAVLNHITENCFI